MSILVKDVSGAPASKTRGFSAFALIAALLLIAGLSASALALSPAPPNSEVNATSVKAPTAITVTITNSAQVYYPATVKKKAKFKKPAVLLTSTVFDSISEWKTIKKKKLTEKDAEYHLLLKKANDKFAKALKKVQRDGKYDIIAETGAITCKGVTATDVTQDLVKALS